MIRAARWMALLAVVLVPGAVFAQADVIVGDLYNLNSYGTENGIYGYAVGTESCNIGTVELAWFANSNLHPVIGQEMYRLKDGVLEQVGISWLKHGFATLNNNLCATCQPTAGTTLGVGCSDPYGAGLNGTQSNLGPRSLVNAYTGVFPYPFSAPPYDPTSPIDRRLQVHAADLDPAQNVGATYYVTSHYVMQDDAANGSDLDDNNASYREIVVDPDPANYQVSFAPGSTTQQQKPGIQIWQDVIPTVTIEEVVVPGEGLMMVGYHVTDNGNGTWHYEYAVYNMNSDRSAGSFQVQFPGSVNITNIGFRDVDHHSGEPYSGIDWSSTFTPGIGVQWQTDAYSVNQNANAIRWSTMYNFRFDADAPPASGLAAIGLFKPGTPTQVTVPVDVPFGSSVPAVTGLTCVPGAGEVNLAWTNGTAYDNLEIRRDGSFVALIAGTETSYADVGVAPGNHTWDVRGYVGPDASFPTFCDALVTLRFVEVEDTNAFAGQSPLEMPVLSSHSSPLEGFTLSIQYPSDRLTAIDWTIAGTATEAAVAEFEDLQMGPNYLTAEVILDFVGPFAGQTIPTGDDITIAIASFEVSATVVEGETRVVAFLDGLGPSATENTVRIGGLDQPPLTGDATVTFFEQPTFVRGDCNADTFINIADPISNLDYMFAGGATPSCLSACDFDDNGAINIADAINQLSNLFTGSPAIPAPWPNPGPDPTPDGLVCN